ncbi:AAA family ATPase [Sediminitomix flava]|uniref:AAA ATPase-like protein n=1 Tax=Sediminitomix flava TaxID=379075 RepID=A0A315ZCE1_SEDFL|nr:AAA family ATPase [Sediminitomix flava]PWJ42763.1 AAA ATPase-like protein [Sediminitomix flava]
MGKIRGLSLENFRVFKERTHFQFSPITVLTGTNSSGKSSLFKALLLLQDNGQKNGLRELDFRGHYHNLGNLKSSMHFDSDEESNLAFEVEVSPDAHRPFPNFELGGKVIVIKLSELTDVKDFPSLLKIYNWKNWMFFLEHHFRQTARKLYRFIKSLPEDFQYEHRFTLKRYLKLLPQIAYQVKITTENIEELFTDLFSITAWLKKNDVTWEMPEQTFTHPNQGYFAVLLKNYWYKKYQLSSLQKAITFGELLKCDRTDDKCPLNETERKQLHTWEEILKNHSYKEINDLKGAFNEWMKSESLEVPKLLQDIYGLEEADLRYAYQPEGIDVTENIYVRFVYDGRTAKLKDVIVWFKERYTDNLKLLYTPLSNCRLQHILGQDGNSYYLGRRHQEYLKTEGDAPIFTSFYDFEHLHQYGVRKITNRPERSAFIVDEKKLLEKVPFLKERHPCMKQLSELIHKKFLLLLGSRVNSYLTEFEENLMSVNEYVKGNMSHFLPELDENNEIKFTSIGFLLKDLPLFNSEDIDILKRKFPETSYEQLLITPQVLFSQEEWAELYQVSVEDVIFDDLDSALELALKGLQQILDGIGSCFNFGLLEAHRGNTQRIILHTDESVLSKLLFDYGKNADDHAKDFVTKWIREFGIGHEIEVNTIKGIAHDVIITDKRGHQLDLASLGYGISQLLPILLKIGLRKEPSLLIEEPETNLHPKLQSMLADLLIDGYNRFNTSFLIETHSEYLIRKLQYWVAKKQVPLDTITIYYLYNPEKIPEEAQQVERLHIKESGELDKSFGTGFYDEADNISIELFQMGQDEHDDF